MKNRIAVAATVVASSIGAAHAALPEEVETAFTGIQTDFTSLLGLAWPVIATFVGAFLLIKFFKRITAKL